MSMFTNQFVCWIIWSVLCIYHCQSRCVINVTTSDTVRTKWDSAVSLGCSIHFEAGIHTTTQRLGGSFDGGSDWSDPVEIYGDGVDNTKLYRPNANQNMMDISGSYFRIRDIEIEGGSKGVRCETNISYAEFINLKIHGTADGGFTANTNYYEYQNMLINNVEIYDTSGYGECFYLGCNDNKCLFHDNIIEYSYCHDTYSVYGSGQGDGIDLKGGAYSNIIRNNIIINTTGPGILTYDSYDKGNNIIQNNIILDAGNVGVQVTAGVELYNNIIHSSCCHAFNANRNQLLDGTEPRNIILIGNTIVSQHPSTNGGQYCFEARDWDTNPSTFVIKNNLILCGDDNMYNNTETAMYFNPSSGVVDTAIFENNALYGYNDDISSYPASNFKISTNIANTVQDWLNYNYYPLQNSNIIGNGIYDSNSPKDIDCVNRDNPSCDIGAYEYSSGRTEPLFYVNANIDHSIINVKDLCITPTTSNPTSSTPTTTNPTTNIPTVVPGSPTRSPVTSQPITYHPTTNNPTISPGTPTSSPVTLQPTIAEPIIKTSSILSTNMISTINIEDSSELDREYYAYIFLDFSDYSLFDWILFGASALLILICCSVCICCIYKVHNKAHVASLPDSKMNSKTGNSRISLYKIDPNAKDVHSPNSDPLNFQYKPQIQMIENPDNPKEQIASAPYTSNYDATPMKNGFKSALSGIQRNNGNRLNVMPTNDDNDGRDHGLSTFSTASFGKIKPDQPLFRDNNSEQHVLQEYDDDYEDDTMNNQPVGPVPPPVRPSMFQQNNNGPPPVRQSMLRQMNNQY